MMSSAEQLASELMDTLVNHVRIEQSSGAVAQVHSISLDEAYVLMWLHATAHLQALGDVAQAVVADPASVPELMTPRPG